jgi:carbon monoxide dehydrogenase subunit G
MLYTIDVFSQATILIDRTVEEIYAFLADLPKQLRCWDALIVPGLSSLPSDTVKVDGTYRLGTTTYDCVIELYRTRPGAGVVTRVSWTNGELAAEWRVMEEGDRTRVELNVEGQGGGLATNVHVRRASQHLVTRLKQQFDVA